ncbi:acyl-CoA dehydrogenase family member 9 [Schistosoma bovis]|uniref:NADH dehydrogenase [ubiquinone] 1 alpha subcomplex assembly factor 3 n=1 Tax=Schistosoma bovis TaxID=6184 RepID=A0A430QP72_SCHBO|nr:acyl-CoA dehydrogenase family member 9 [Schistosoma bovis]
MVNYNTPGVYFAAYNPEGFILNTGVKVIGPCAAFPRFALSWKVKDALDISEESLSLLFMLEPPLEVLIIGKGETKSPVDYQRILNICWKHRLPVEVMSTHHAIGTFNFLNSERRYVAAAVIPPRRLDVYDEADKKATHLLLERESQQSDEIPLLSPTSTKLLESSDFKGDIILFNRICNVISLRRIAFTGCNFPSKSTGKTHECLASFSTEITNERKENDASSPWELDKPKRIWPNQLPVPIEVVTPPFSTTVAATSKAPLIKDFFRGQVNLELFEFLELQSRREVDDLDAMHNQIKRFILKMDSYEIDRNCSLSKEMIHNLNELGLLALCIDKEYDGLGFNTTQWMRACEAIGLDGSVWTTLTAHQSLTAKAYYLPKLASGEFIGGFCLSEISSGNDIQALTSLAVLNETDDHYILNGHKTWVTNGAVADVFVVFARTLSSNTAQNVLVLHRLNTVASGVGVLRYLLSYTAEHCLQRHQFGKPIGDYSRVEEKLSEIVLNLYAMESGLFYFSGLLDAQPSRNLSLELAALKIFSSEKVWSGIDTCIQLAGRSGLLKNVPYERFLRDARNHLTSMESNDILRIMIAGEGITEIIPGFEKTISDLSVFTRHPITNIKTKWLLKRRKQGKYAAQAGSGPKVTEGNASRDLKDHLHPSFADMATRLAINTQRFQSLCQISLIQYGREITNEQMLLCQLADAAIDLLLTSICFGRASRSISIGLPRNDYEKTLAHTFSRLALRRVEHVIEYKFEIDRYQHRVASELLTQRFYPVSHPLARVW